MEQSPKEIFIAALRKAGTSLGLPKEKLATIVVEPPRNSAWGDYASTLALTSFKDVRDRYPNSIHLSQAIWKELEKDATFTKIFNPNPFPAQGYINATLNDEYLQTLLTTIVSQKEAFGSSAVGKGKTAIVDLSAPNVAKRFSIGHLRSTIIGDAIVKLFRFQGWTVIGDNHLGDWDTQFGKMMVAIRKWADKPANELTIAELEALYVRFHTEAEKNETLNDEARAAFKALEDGKKEERELWKTLVTNSMKEFNKLYDLLDVHIDEAYGESSYEKIMPEVIDLAKKKGIAVESQGALVIPFPGNKLPPGILRKSDGATTYFTRDIATIYVREKTWHPDKMIYEIGAEQTLHLRQVFWAAELLGLSKRQDCIHVAHGFVRLKEGRMSTRKGNAIKLDEVITKIIEKAKTLNSDEKIATTIGIGALKYNDLKRTPSQGYTFDWDEALTLNGNSGPYLQYTCVRCKGILEKGKGITTDIHSYVPNSDEMNVVRLLSQFPEIVKHASDTYMPSTLCTNLYELAQKFSSFYEKHSVNSAENPQAKSYRLMLTQSVLIVLTNGLALLGIRVPEKM